jgi:hypothetical protein
VHKCLGTNEAHLCYCLQWAPHVQYSVQLVCISTHTGKLVKSRTSTSALCVLTLRLKPNIRILTSTFNNYCLKNSSHITRGSRDSASGYSDWLWTGQPGGRSSSPDRGKISLLSTSSGLILGPNQPPIQWVRGLFPWG